jgi:anthranilate phosphoribosyltransferase
VQRFRQVLDGLEKEACEDFTALNTAAILVVAGISPTLSAGVKTARDAIRSGSAARKLTEWVATQ